MAHLWQQCERVRGEQVQENARRARAIQPKESQNGSEPVDGRNPERAGSAELEEDRSRSKGCNRGGHNGHPGMEGTGQVMKVVGHKA